MSDDCMAGEKLSNSCLRDVMTELVGELHEMGAESWATESGSGPCRYLTPIIDYFQFKDAAVRDQEGE